MKGTCRTTQWGDRATHLVWSIFHGISCTCEWSFWHVAMRQLFSTIILTPLLSPTEFTMGISYTCESGSRDLINGFCSPRHGSSYTIHSTWVVNWGTFWIRKAWGRYPLQNHDKFLGDLCAQFSVALTYVDSTKGTGCNIIQFIILLLWFYCFMSKGRGFCSFARLNKCLYHLPWNPFPLLPSPPFCLHHGMTLKWHFQWPHHVCVIKMLLSFLTGRNKLIKRDYWNISCDHMSEDNCNF